MTTASQLERKGRIDPDNGDIKQDLLRAAMHLLSTKGRDGATMRAICAEVGVTPPTLYHHYGDLQGLHKAAIDETYLQVAEAYHDGTEEKGPLKGIRDGWATFLKFAYSEPNMCRIVIQQIMAGEPPSLVADTLRGLADDLAQFHAQGLLKYPPRETAQLLWMGALGSLTYTVSREEAGDTQDLALQRAMLEITLAALFNVEKE
ncbi:TetR/AcrR family transcriptional regulator [Pseudomonas sp. BN102]|uniref:TetR/AcrR family transcriptional regulator n=1 Tax=Pseudomonas sp. BN102 TaxID=2567886 RepID=UPI002454C8C8|nr:TetR/AcrR family transcriptional regulator [Pseudomonas sp. BN102]MDH4609111.1 TetR/AcrR family transcriptional regulator [Pseudomonas sp. BN102]